MNESFNIKRFFALIVPFNWKRQLIGSVIGILFLIVFYSLYQYKTDSHTYAFVFFGAMHFTQFNFMSNQSAFSAFLLVPATNLEKYLALFTKAILFPILIALFVVLGMQLFYVFLPNYSSNPVFKIEQLYVSTLLFIILFCLRFVLRWNSFIVYFVIYMGLLAPMMFANKYLKFYLGHFTNSPVYISLFYVLLSASFLFLTYPQMMKLQINRIKEKVDKI